MTTGHYNAGRLLEEAMQDASLQGNFVRAADAIIVQGLAQLVICTAQELLALLKAPGSSAPGRVHVCCTHMLGLWIAHNFTCVSDQDESS